MPVGEQFQQISKRIDIQFLFQQIGTKRPHTFEVFDGRG
jgi:hypothetical protein